MRGHVLYHEFDRRWQLPVYFQLRWKEIVVDAEDALNELSIEPLTVQGVCYIEHGTHMHSPFVRHIYVCVDTNDSALEGDFDVLES
jgi:hypothetical protein